MANKLNLLVFAYGSNMCLERMHSRVANECVFQEFTPLDIALMSGKSQ
jgi:hypothetical protein